MLVSLTGCTLSLISLVAGITTSFTVTFGERMKMIYMQTLIKWLRLLFYKKSAFDGYTFDLDEYTPITEEDYESVTALSSPAVTSPRRRSKGSTSK
jgi:hypothetical protein